jgi:hypothetical protein
MEPEDTQQINMEDFVSTEQIESLIFNMLLARSKMQPSVPLQIAAGVANIPLLLIEPNIAFGKTGDGKPALHIRHPGMGWITCIISPHTMRALGLALMEQDPFPDVGGVPN